MSKKKIIIFAAANLLLFVLIGLCLMRSAGISETLLSQQASQRWEGEGEQRFAQVSCFYPTGKEKSESQINTFRLTIDKKLAEAGIEEPETGKNWTDAYSSLSTVHAEGERGSSEATAIGVGGDFFLFHPYELLSGSYISDDDLMTDRVVIDRELAWKLFGGTELEGMTIEVEGKQCYIAGVIAREDDKFSQRCFSDEPLIFMRASELSEGTEASDISTYELTMLDPISGFALKTATDGIAGDDTVVVENSERYSFSAIFGIFKNFGARSIQTKAVAYPYWENAARISEVYVARYYVIIALLGLFPLICAIALLIKLIKFLVKGSKALSAKAKDAWEDRYGIQEELKEKRAAKRAGKAAEDRPRRKKHRSKAPDAKAEDVKKPPKEKKRKQPKEKTKKTSKRAEKKLRKDPPQDTPQDEQDFLPDIESIVREVLEDERK